MNFVKISLLSMSAVSLALGGCASGGSSGPDEFRVLTKAPLEIPPEYNVVPPRPGEPRPQDLEAAQAARNALLGIGNEAGVGSAGEAALIAAARGKLNNETIRTRLDAETNRQTTKSKSFADRILFWRGADNYIEDDTLLDADAEAERLSRKESADNATGGGDVVIRKKKNRIKLPGL